MTERTGHILIVDDDDDILTAGRLLLRRNFAGVTTCRDPSDISQLLAANDFDAVLLDMNFGPGESSGQQGLHWLQQILQIEPGMVVVMITAHGDVQTVVEAMKRGATDFIAKPWQNEKVVATVSAAVALHRSRDETENLKRTNRVLQEAAAGANEEIIYRSDAMAQTLALVHRAAPTEANVLILGENGTGKELVARELHRHSARAGAVFLPVDMGSISESLFESELFGHRKGAFTGAAEDRAGRFQAASGGTLFLDEIGNLPLHLQAKLLGALELHQVTPLGADRPEPVDVRVIAATNTPVAVLRDPAVFRPDLLFRLNTVEITLPPLRERPEDILLIARHFVERYSKKYGKAVKTFSADTEAALSGYEWPGNVRALRHAVERAVIMAPGDLIGPRDLQLDYSVPAEAPAEAAVVKAGTAPGTVPGIASGTASGTAGLNLEQIEKQTIERALHKHGFNISHAARELGLTRASLYRRMEKHGL